MTGAFADSWIWAIVAAPFIGSFVGLLVLRLPAGQPVAWSRSACPHCGRILGITELVPLASWLVQRGRCRSCAAPLSVFYPLMEIAALVVATWAAIMLPAEWVWPGCILGWALLGAAAIDAQHKILPDLLVLPLIPAGIILHALLAPERWEDHVLGAVAGFVFFAALGWLYHVLRGREGLGLGDAKLLAAAGAWVAWIGLPAIVFLAALFGMAGALVMRLAGRQVERTTEIPFGPALALAIWLVWLYGPVLPA